MRTLAQRSFHRMACVIGLLCSILVQTACLNWNAPQLPDEILFRRAVYASDHGKNDVARITLQVMLNTYPDSKYSPEANELLQRVNALSTEDNSGNPPSSSECPALGDPQI
jgi:hypothetical protein